MKMPSSHRDEIVRTINLMVQPGGVTELRALDAALRSDRRIGTVSGYFDSADKLADAVAQIDKAKGIYFIPNVVNPDLLARVHNRVRITGKGDTLTGDKDILRRFWLLMDFDPQRPSGISSSEAEHALSRQRAEAVRAFLREQGWPEPILADSGNGWHLLYRIDLPTDDGELVKRCLAALAARFDDDAVKVDQTVFNPARIWKVYGTLACKGDSTPDRPHRLSKLVDVPESVQAVTLEQLTALAEQSAPQQQVNGENWAAGMLAAGAPRFDIDAWVQKFIPDAGEPKQWGGGPKMWSLPKCPFSNEHTDGAYIGVLASGAITAGCHHNSCQGKKWDDLREKFEPAATRQKSQQWGETGAAAAGQVEWGRPRPFDNGPIPPEFPLEAAFPPGLIDMRLYVEAVAEQLQVPIDLSAMTLLPMVSVCVAQKFEIELRPGWREIAAIWVLALLLSGERKSGTFSILVAPILEWEKDEHERLAPLIAKCAEERKIAEARLAEARKKAAKAKPENVRELTAKAVELAQELAEMPVVRAPTIYTSDATTEALAGLLVENQERALVASPEADALDVMMGRYAEKNTPNMGIWLKGHAGDAERVLRRSRQPEFLKRPALSVGMVVQPEAVRGMLANRAARGRGLLARFFCSAPKSMLGRRKTGGAAKAIPAGLAAKYRTAIRRLLNMQIDKDRGPAIVLLDQQALAMFNTFEANIERNLGPNGGLCDRSDWGGKLCGAVARIALLLYALQLALEGSIDDPNTCEHLIGADIMKAALSWAPYLIDHERLVAGVVGCDRDTTVAQRLVTWITREGLTEFTRRDAFSNNRSVMVQEVEDVDGALGLLEEYGYIRRKPEPASKPSGGRPRSPSYLVNPNLNGGVE